MSSKVVSHSLPAPAMHAGFSAHQSKSYVLAGVQDAYWSDDDADDAECPLCLEEMDISDLNFKPCVCGYQVCRFCWHHIKENLNGRCPACRREYTDEAVQFKAIPQEDHKRLTQQKKQRERERKELDALGRRHLVNVRVVQRNVVYVVGIGPRFAKEELIPTLRSNDYFGQYGKISKMILVKRTQSGGGAPVVGLYITYHRREDAARCIATVDGSSSPGGGREVMRASYGTTKYCMAFLRGVNCSDGTCMSLHEWGDEKDCFTKEDLTTLKHTIKDTENRSRGAKDGDGPLPRAAAWGTKVTTPGIPTAGTSNFPSSITQRPTRRGGPRQPRIESKPPNRLQHERKAAGAKTPSVTSSSRPSTPATATLPPRPATPAEVKSIRSREHGGLVSPAPSTAIESDLGSGSQDVSPSPVRPRSTESVQSSSPSNIVGVPNVPPGLSAPPGLPPPQRKTDLHAPLGIQPSQSTYQMSTAAQALLDDVKSRRENALANVTSSIFPDLDRTLRMLSEDDKEFGGFSFNLDPKLASDNSNADIVLPDLEVEAATPFTGSFMDAFPALRPNQPQQQFQSQRSLMGPPPGIPYPPNSSRSVYEPPSIRSTPVDHQSPSGSNYLGSFNPFGESTQDPPSQPQAGVAQSSAKSTFPDEERKVSRFGFARGRQGSATASSPVHAASPLSASDSHQSLFSAEVASSPAQPYWGLSSHHEYGYQTSPLAQHAQVAQSPPQQQARFQPFDNSLGISEAQLREFLQASRERASVVQNGTAGSEQQQSYAPNQPFHDPAIMSARLASPVLSMAAPTSYPAGLTTTATNKPSMNTAMGPPPGLGFPPGIPINHPTAVTHLRGSDIHVEASRLNALPNIPQPAPTSPALSPEDFPALSVSTAAAPATQVDLPSVSDIGSTAESGKDQAKTDRKAAKKAAAAQRALERQKVAQEKAAAKAAEKARIAQEKAAEKEKLAVLKEEKEKAERERVEEERIEKERQVEERAKADAVRAEKAQAAVETEHEQVSEKTKVKTPKIKKAATPQKAARVGQSASVSVDTLANAPPKAPEPVDQPPILSKMPKKNKPTARPIKIPKDHEIFADEASALPSAASEAPVLPTGRSNQTFFSSPNDSRAQSVEMTSPLEEASLAELLDEIDAKNPHMELPHHPFFDVHKINPASKMPLQYGPLVHALSALSVGGGSFATSMPSGSIDNAVSSFQQLLETLTQTISDLLRLLPRTTWDDSSSFDGVLRDMLKGDDFLDEAGDEAAGKDDEVAALTLALERRARWMEVQLSKLEELHRDINTAAVRAVFAFNDNGWDRHKSLPRIGNTLRRFDSIGMVEENGRTRPMTVEELEKKLVVAKEAAVFAETELREAMEKLQHVRPLEDDDY